MLVKLKLTLRSSFGVSTAILSELINYFIKSMSSLLNLSFLVRILSMWIVLSSLIDSKLLFMLDLYCNVDDQNVSREPPVNNLQLRKCTQQ
jgi:hypothetical protein